MKLDAEYNENFKMSSLFLFMFNFSETLFIFKSVCWYNLFYISEN